MKSCERPTRQRCQPGKQLKPLCRISVSVCMRWMKNEVCVCVPVPVPVPVCVLCVREKLHIHLQEGGEVGVRERGNEKKTIKSEGGTHFM